MTISDGDATAFAREWIAAWNAHDLDRILSHYDDTIEFSSPRIRQLTGADLDTVTGKDALRQYWEAGLRLLPDLHFSLVGVCVGTEQLVVVYRNERDQLVAECMTQHRGRVIRASAAYGETPAVVT